MNIKGFRVIEGFYRELHVRNGFRSKVVAENLNIVNELTHSALTEVVRTKHPITAVKFEVVNLREVLLKKCLRLDGMK